MREDVLDLVETLHEVGQVGLQSKGINLCFFNIGATLNKLECLCLANILKLVQHL